MNPLQFRRARRDDFDRWYQHSFDPAEHHLARKRGIRDEWLALLKPPALCLLAEEPVAARSSLPARPMMFARILFVTDAFFEEMDDVAGIQLNQVAHENRTPSGKKSLLTKSELDHFNHPDRGLHCLLSAIHVYEWIGPLERPLLDNQMRFEILKRMEGWYIRSFIACLLHESVIVQYEQVGFERRRSYIVNDEVFTIVTLERQKAVSSNTPLVPFFVTPAPRCYFAPRQRQVLALLLEDLSQEEACEILGMARRTMETICRQIRQRYERTMQEEATTIRTVLRYVRNHPEEVRALVPEQR